MYDNWLFLTLFSSLLKKEERRKERSKPGFKLLISGYKKDRFINRQRDRYVQREVNRVIDIDLCTDKGREIYRFIIN